MKSIEDFTEFEQRAAYFDGDPVAAQKKGVTILERGSQVHFMAEVQDLMDFPPAPKLNVLGKLDPFDDMLLMKHVFHVPRRKWGDGHAIGDETSHDRCEHDIDRGPVAKQIIAGPAVTRASLSPELHDPVNLLGHRRS